MKKQKLYFSADLDIHTVRIKTSLEIDRSERYAQYDPFEEITLLYFPRDSIRSDGKLKGFNYGHKRFEYYDIVTLSLAVIEHESIHDVLNKVIDLDTCRKLDNTNLEEIRDCEYFPKLAVNSKKSDGQKQED